ncbi:putative masquerade-like serine proteinase-like [Homarus americanus]|uniref:Putative masquerade-like serine proteinase-like n=1 Tax=Homarus americanus TaxID=6706 RepID=A0A8J5JG36_HOMAM|nr:putative masquerade-like serine proteinase-like [Homarus americanus]
MKTTRIKRLLVVTMMMWATTWSNVDAQSDGFFWWLQKVTTTPMPNTNPSTTTQGPVYCECVKYYLCIDNVISTSGVDVIDIRMARVGPPSVTNVKECPDVLDVCCGLPPSETTTPPITPTPTLPPDTPCECVSFFNCTRDRLVSNGGGNTTLELFGLGYSHSKCNQALAVCCALDPATPSPANITTVVTPLTEEECECVDPFQCDEHGYIITSGVGIINIRTRTHSRNDSYPDERCEDPSLVCCRPPRDLNSTTTPLPTTTTPPPTTTQQPAHGCGTRHSDGVRVSLAICVVLVMVLYVAPR